MAAGMLSPDQQATYDSIVGMGFPPDQAKHAAIRYGDQADQAINWLFENPDFDFAAPLPALTAPPTSDYRPSTPVDAIPSTAHLEHAEATPQSDTTSLSAAPPPPPPAYQESVFGPHHYQEKEKSLLPAVYVPPSSKPDLDLTSFYPTDSHATDLQKAIEASTAVTTANAAAANVNVPDEEEDDEMSKALALSMASLGSAEHEQSQDPTSIIESIDPRERIRSHLETPLSLRTVSPLMSIVSSYLQCLYSISTWRNTILAWTRPESTVTTEFDGVWKGDSPQSLTASLDATELELAIDRLTSVQRLFALMHDSRRSFVHVQEVVKAFDLRENQFHHSSGTYRITEMHNQIIRDLHLTKLNAHSELVGDEQVDKDLVDKFTISGRRVFNNDHIGAPLAPVDDQTRVTTNILSLDLNPAASPAQTFFDRLDETLLSIEQRRDDPFPQFHLLTNPPPQTVVFQLNRQTSITSLEHFGSNHNSQTQDSTETSGNTGGRNLFKVEPKIWLDRYHVSNRVAIKHNRDKLVELKRQVHDLSTKRGKLGLTRNGKDAVEVVKGVVDYLESTQQDVNLEDEFDRPDLQENDSQLLQKRRERQERLKVNYRAILDTMLHRLEEYDGQLNKLDNEMSTLFEPAQDWQTIGPYHLVSLLFRNGLNGRGSCWSVSRADDGKWYKVNDLVCEPIELNQALDDRTGLFMDAGITLAFYQLEGQHAVEVQVLDDLKRAVARDNHAFAATLPHDSHAEEVESWKLPPLESVSLPPLEPEHDEDLAIPITIEGRDGEDEGDTVQNISLTPPPSATPVPSVVETPMSVDHDEDDELEPLIPEDPLRLRGGASPDDDDEDEEEDEEEYDEDDEIDEDEVELGLLQPMSKEWDIDYAVGKVGGVPVWLDPRSPLETEQVTCEVCEKTMSMLLQVNSPDDTRPHAAARSLYVYACRQKGCLAKDASKAVKVWRTQMSSPNEFFPHTEETLAKRRELEAALDVKSGLQGTPTTATKPWPEWDIAAEPEPYEESYLPDPAAPSPEQAEGEDADAPDTISGVDKEFLAFQERIEREPKQVLRFYRLPDVEEPEPLWTSKKKVNASEVPPCELCRGPREIEFQILSTLLSHLDDDILDFDSLLVYTCLDNCQIPPRAPVGDRTGWAVEVAFKQDFTASGVRFGGIAQ
ncbi:uncharacterized protein JCM15063_002413 [Sporobolomyces koalae]|uniref:uncharacterized protein n=1 Tax=Sporobolomyces koalae TaxID=500713 RepID=UPI00316C2328